MWVSKLLGWLGRCVACSFCVFPRSYRDKFEDEMRSIYFLAAEEAGQKGGRGRLQFIAREFWGIVIGASREYWLLVFGKRGGQMKALAEGEDMVRNGQHSLPGDIRSWCTLVAGTFLFLLWGLVMTSGELAFPDYASGSALLLATYQLSSWLVFLLPTVVVGYGWTHKFPRWTYAYAGSALLYTYMVAANLIASPQIRLAGITAGTGTWGWRAWIPLGLAIVFGICSTRSIRPLAQFFTNAWVDWTVLSYAMFGWMPILLYASFDEVASGITLIFMPLTISILVVAAGFYLASQRIFQRVGSLLCGTYLGLGLTLMVTEIYWSGIGGFNSGRILLILTVFAGVLFSPALIGAVRYFQQRNTLRQL